MIRLCRHRLLFKPPSLLHACSQWNKFNGPSALPEALVCQQWFSSVKQSVGKRQQTVNSVRVHQERTRPEQRDPVRSVSNRLLLSLRKRHDTECSSPKAKMEPGPSASLPVSSTLDLIHAVYSVPNTASDKQEQLDTLQHSLRKHLQRMTLTQALQACHGFYLQQYRFHSFLSELLSVADNRFDELCPSASEITHLLFFVFTHGSAPSMLLHNVESYVLKNLDKFHINDLGVVCVGFFRANSRLVSQDLLDAIAEKLLRDIDSLDPFLLLDFVKTFRHASYIKVSFYEELAKRLIKSGLISHYKTLNPIMHLAFMYASIPVQNFSLFEHLFSHAEHLLKKKQAYVRSKDISKFVWACGTLQFKSEGYERRYMQLVHMFETVSKDHTDYPESIAEMLMGCVYLGLFPHRLLGKCLSPEVANKLLVKGADKEKSFQLLLLNESVKLECPDYTGHLLSQGQINSALHQASMQGTQDTVRGALETELLTRPGLGAVLSSLQRCLGQNRVLCTHPFLHFRTAVIELWYSQDCGFLEVDASVSRQPSDTFTQKSITDSLYSALTSTPTTTPHLPQTYARLAIVVTSSNQFALNDPSQPLGHLHTMLRQLHTAGYTLVQILPEEALQLELSSHEDRCHHLSTVLSSVLQTDVSLT